MGTSCSTDDLRSACQDAQDSGKVHLDLSEVLGLKNGPTVSVDNLLQVIASHEDPQVSVSWSDKTLTLQKTDGGAIASFSLEF